MSVPFKQRVGVRSFPRAAVRNNRKVGILGSYPASLATVPWDDPSWELWGHACSRNLFIRKLDRYFDLHPKSCWTRPLKRDKAYIPWLESNVVPIYMQEAYSEIPASIAYPKGRVLEEYGYPRPYFTNQLSWMIALALIEGGVTTLGLWGINYSARSEYGMQRGSAEYWIGRAVERGIRVVLPENCTLLREPAGLYGYESHDETTGKLKDDYKKYHQMFLTPIDPNQIKKDASPTSDIKRMIAEEPARPEWADPSRLYTANVANRTNGGVHE